jgi:glycosyltransferase involved in cell wall biosynthesis
LSFDGAIRLKILHVIPTLDPRAGGPPLIAARLAAAQAALGNDVHVMTYKSKPPGQQRIRDENEKLVGFDRLTLHLLPYITNYERLFGRRAKKSAEQIVGQMDIVHIHGIWEPQLWHAAYFARQHHKPYLVLLHGMLFPWAMQRGKLKKRLAFAMGARSMLNYGVFQFGNKDEEISTCQLGFKQPGAVIPNGISLEVFEALPAPGTFARLRPELENNPFVLFLGRLHEQKGIDLLLSAFEKALKEKPSVRLVIAGPDYGRSDLIQKQIVDAKMQNRILLTGPIFGEEKLAALREAVCFCLPSRHEGFSLAILEAMTVGTPVVISAQCHFPEVAEAGAGAIVPLDPLEICKAILSFLNDSAYRDKTGRAARQLVLKDFVWPEIARKTIAVYQQLLDDPTRSSFNQDHASC